MAMGLSGADPEFQRPFALLFYDLSFIPGFYIRKGKKFSLFFLKSFLLALSCIRNSTGFLAPKYKTCVAESSLQTFLLGPSVQDMFPTAYVDVSMLLLRT